MAKSNAVWGIDIGQCALKALRCRLHEDPARITADAFDFIEYPKILSQPDADPAELIREAIATFLSRNSARDDRIAISVSGQSGLARFIKLPPVELKKLRDIVKYEARQQIPFALEDVVWDYQQLAGGSMEEGFALESEVGLFAMKRDQVFRALRPFEEAGIEVDLIQLAPLAIYNFTVFDQLQGLVSAEEYDAENPPESVVVISMGTDATDLVITNGYRVWQRSIAVGGNHFTKALTKELRLTFANAEHLKRNADKTEDPKAVFQAMRPVFNDLLTELQRSINYFASLDRRAKIGRVVALGNAMRLHGLQRYLSQYLGHPIAEVTAYRGLAGPQVTAAPAFKENLLSFAVCYGLTLQGLGRARLATNLLPRELVTQRLIRDKKPWAVAAAAAVLLGCAINFSGYARAVSDSNPDLFKQVFSQADSVASQAQSAATNYQTALDEYKRVCENGKSIVAGAEQRLLWLELLKAINAGLPHDPPGSRPQEIYNRNELHISQIEMERFEDLSTWHQAIQGASETSPPGAGGISAASSEEFDPAVDPIPPPVDPAAAPASDATGSATEGPKGTGWVVQLKGYHYHNELQAVSGAEYVRRTLIDHLQNGKATLPTGEGDAVEEVSLAELGISFPVVADAATTQIRTVRIPNPDFIPPERTSRGTGGGRPAVADTLEVREFEFTVQFCWQETPRSERLKKKAQKQLAEQQAAQTAAAAGQGEGELPVDAAGAPASPRDPAAAPDAGNN